jgi:putative endonuclease
MTRGGTVYMMASLNHQALYTGVTSDLISRVQEHKNKVHDFSFTSKYNCVKLVYYNSFSTIDEAILEEKRIKGGSRKKKEILINSMNPEWKDLWEEIKYW